MPFVKDGITVVRSAERLRARLADAERAGAPGVKIRSPLLEIRRMAMTFNDAPVEFRRLLINTEHYKYSAIWRRRGMANCVDSALRPA